MNIKSVNTMPILPIDPKQRIEGGVRTQSSTDRDADGRRQSEEQENKRNLSQQEFDDCIKTLGDHPGLKANNLTLKVEEKDGLRTIFILSPEGGVVRRLSESQLWQATRDKDRQTGKILDKAM